MAASTQTKGACAYCGHETTRGHMARHLAACDKRRETIASADARGGTAKTLVHLQVRDAESGAYWLNLEVDGDAPLQKVDSYLRAIWLECCDHLSDFSTGGWGGRKVGKRQTVGAVFGPGVEITHTYDFGTSSTTLLKAVDVREGKRSTKHPIELMARNHAPAFTCQECGERAVRLCMECVYEENAAGTLCEHHAAQHPHDDYGEPVALVNSPRVGMCGYDGPAEPPY
ncbi:MAG TPA: hypothetical protein VFJ16_13940 [Longimicrobium sp.]|nr:hypothetical protein [Longimicrobium sp.]